MPARLLARARPEGALARLGFLAALMFAGMAGFAARADEAPPRAPKCETSYEEASSYGHLGVAADESAVFSDYGGEEARKLLAGINAFPPVSDWAADHVLVFDAPDEPILIALVDRGCVAEAFKLPRDDWARVRSAAIGDPS